jgi:hypothetical protein
MACLPAHVGVLFSLAVTVCVYTTRSARQGLWLLLSASHNHKDDDEIEIEIAVVVVECFLL